MMKLTAIFLLALCLNAAAKGYAQRVSLSEQNASLEKVFLKIKNQTGYSFISTKELLQTAKPVTINISNAPIEKVLDLCFKDQPLTYTIINKLIVVKKKEKSLTAIVSPIQESAPVEQPITGKVTDSEGKPVVGASVVVKNSKKGTTTNADGVFTFHGLEKGTYTIEISSVGYATQEIQVSVSESKSETLSIVMKVALNQIDEFVVTGVFDKRKKMEASVAISTVNDKQIAKLVPVSASDLLKNVPGIFVNSSLGEVRNTVYSRGVSANSNEAAQGYYYVSMQEDGLPVTNITYANYGPDYFLRPDATLGKLEAVRGGTASILGANAPGGIFNYVMKEGTEKTAGEIRTRFGLEGDGRNGYYRADVNIGGPLGHNFFYNAGGFYRYGQGVQHGAYPINNGGQFKGNIVKKYATGSLKLYAKYLNDHNLWQIFLPTVGFQNPKVLPGFHTYSPLNTPSVQQNFMVNQTGRVVTANSSNKAHLVDRSVGLNWEQRFGTGWTFNNAARLSKKAADWHLMGHFNPMEGDNFLMYAILGSLGIPGTYSFKQMNTGEEILRVQSDGLFNNKIVNSRTPGGSWIPNSLFWMPLYYMDHDVNEFMDQFSFTKKLKKMTFTAGGFYAHSRVDLYRGIAANGFAPIEERPELLNITLTDASGKVYQVTNSNGFTTGRSLDQSEAKQNQQAFFFGHNWQMAPNLNLDWGVRFESVRIKGKNSPGVIKPGPTGGVDGNPLTLYDNTFGSTPESYAFNKKVNTFSYSAGLNYKINNQYAVYGRVSSGRKAPDLNIYWAANSEFALKNLDPIAQEVFQVEAGVKAKTEKLNLFVTPFYSILSNVPLVQNFQNADATSYQAPTLFQKYRTVGVEVEGDYRLSKHFSVRGVATYQYAKTLEYDVWSPKGLGPADDTLYSYSGNEADNTPRTMLNITPSYNTDKFYAQISWLLMGKRQANVANAFRLPSFSQFNFSTGYDVSKHFSLGIVINNVFNKFGVMSWSPPGNFLVSLDRQAFSKEDYEEAVKNNKTYTTYTIPPRAYFLTGTFRF